MPTALFVSPHLDDVAFSCGGLAALLADRGWHTVLATAFTRSVVPATGFALACQLDKGLPPDVDYMALRRAEDAQAAAILGFTATHWLDLLEAPHRGYHSAPALFGDIHPADGVAIPLGAALMELMAALDPALVLAPQGLGNHVDHQLVIAAVLQVVPPGRIAFYRDTPYAIRQPDAAAFRAVPAAPVARIDITVALDRKIAAAQAYASQIGFQFGGADRLADAMRAFALAEGRGTPGECFLGEAIRGLALDPPGTPVGGRASEPDGFSRLDGVPPAR
jgi:LmbE family N-acetylglucosaminyl deacetylase